MKALLSVNGYYHNPNNDYKVRRLMEEFSFSQVECEVKDAIALLPCCDGKSISLDLSSYDFAIDLDKDNYLAKVLSMKLPLFNSYESMMLSDDKMLSILALDKSGVRAPKTIPAPLCYVSTPDPDREKAFLDRVEEELSYPLVYKACHGSLGKQVELIHNRKELEEVETRNRYTEHLYEKFLSLHQGHDYRIIVIDDEVVACMERRNEHDFRSNIALGGIGRDVTDTLDSSYRELAIRASHALGLLYAGIDVGIDDNNQPIFIEANGNAFFTEIEKVSGINIAKKLVEAILKKLR